MDAKNQGYARGVVSGGGKKLMDSLAQPIAQIQASPTGDDDFQFKEWLMELHHSLKKKLKLLFN